jgi:AraC-like DNA-binding protein
MQSRFFNKRNIHLSISEIGYMSGFSSESSFIVYLKKRKRFLPENTEKIFPRMNLLKADL